MKVIISCLQLEYIRRRLLLLLLRLRLLLHGCCSSTAAPSSPTTTTVRGQGGGAAVPGAAPGARESADLDGTGHGAQQYVTLVEMNYERWFAKLGSSSYP